jgi:hypothetical protein
LHGVHDMRNNANCTGIGYQHPGMSVLACSCAASCLSVCNRSSSVSCKQTQKQQTIMSSHGALMFTSTNTHGFQQPSSIKPLMLTY